MASVDCLATDRCSELSERLHNSNLPLNLDDHHCLRSKIPAKKGKCSVSSVSRTQDRKDRALTITRRQQAESTADSLNNDQLSEPGTPPQEITFNMKS